MDDIGAGEARLRQFEVLWAEIARRSNAQQALVALNVTATGTVSGLAITQGAGAALLVVLAIVSPVLGLLWVDHARNIGVIADFIRTGWQWEPNWEEHSRKEKADDGGRFWLFVAAMTIVFLAPALAGLIASVGHTSTGGQIAAWLTAIPLIAVFFIRWVWQVRQSQPGALRGQ